MYFLWKRILLFTMMMKKPIFIIPGLGGSVLYHKETKEEIWPPTIFNIKNFKENFRTSYKENQFISNHPLETGEIGDCSSIYGSKKWMSWIVGHNYLHTIISFFKKENHPVSCIPYDFRIIGNKEYRSILYKKLKKEIEDYKEKYSEKIILLTHSLGGLFIHFFLLEQTEEWKTRYIDKLITINCPYEGSIRAFDILLKNKIDKPILNTIDYIEDISPFLWLIPNPYTSPNQLILKNKTHTIYHHNITSLLPKYLKDRIDYHFHFFLKNIKYQNNIPTYIIHSSNIPTKLYLDSFIEEDGDGLIPMKSLLFPQDWKNQSYIHFINIPNEEHTHILQSSILLDTLKKLI